MKIPAFKFRRRGSALITVVMLMAMMAVLTASLLTYTMTEKRGNVRNILQLRAKNMAENITLYAAEQISTRFYHSKPTVAYPFTGSNALYMPDTADPVGTATTLGNHNVLGTSPYAVPGSMELYAGVQTPTTMAAVTDPTDSNYGLYVSTVTVPIIAKGTVNHPVNGTFSSYVLQEMKVSMAPLFQFGMFYNMDMELYPSQAFTVAGPVHTNGSLIAHPNSTATIDIRFTDRVTAAGGLYWETIVKAMTRGGNGVESPPTEGNGHVYFTHTNGTTTADLKGSAGTMTGHWYDHKFGQATETAATISKFKTNATTVWNGNVRTSAHGVTKLQLPGIGGYSETNLGSTPEDDRSNGRQLIEPPNAKRYDGTTFTTVTDDADAIESKISWKAGLHILVNPDSSTTPKSAGLPDGSTADVLPGSYRCWLTTINSSNVHSCTEVILPGQPSYGYNRGADGTVGTSDDYMYHNLLPNRFDATTVAGDGTGNAVLRIPQQPFSSASGYLLNGGLAANATTLNVDTGTGPILPGQILTIGAYNYLVTASSLTGSPASGTVTIASPGLRAPAADNAPITVLNPVSGSGTGYALSSAVLLNDTTLPVTGSGTIFPGNTITLASNKYLVTTAPTGASVTSFTVNPGVLAATSGSGVTLNPLDGSLGTGINYFTSGTVSAGGTTINVNNGTGTILPGNIIAIGSGQYVVTAATPVAGPVTTITVAVGPAAAVAANVPVIVDPYRYSGYSTSIAAPSGAISSGAAFPADTLAAPYAYFPADAYFFDLRRANSNRGVTGLNAPGGNTALYNRFAVQYVPRPIAKIDFDMARFRMMVNRTLSAATTTTMYDVRAPNAAAGVTWTNSIFNASGATASFGLGMGGSYNVFPGTADIYQKMRQDPYQMYYAPTTPEAASTIDLITGLAAAPNPASFAVPASVLYDGTAPDAWYDGIAVYLHSVEAEKRHQTSNVPDRIDSGVRMWNGRGPAVSIAAKPGFTFVTNDALYIVGHFNADGTINSVVTSSTASGGYSARYPDNSSTEALCALMGDAITIVSQPVWSDNINGQDTGWNDALSALPHSTNVSGWSTGASSTALLATSSVDGVYLTANGPKSALMPNRSYPGNVGSSTANITKLPADSTEVSTALLCGVVPSNHNPTGLTDGPVESTYSSWGNAPYTKTGNGVNSGGANNFPRLLDAWPDAVTHPGSGLYIRGSIVGLFESRVAMEPFTNSRCYSAPGRYWGLAEGLRNSAHHIPLEPVLIGVNRNRYLELTPAEYEAKKTAILALH